MKPLLHNQLEKIVLRSENYDEKYLLYKLKQLVLEADSRLFSREPTPALDSLLEQYTTRLFEKSTEKNFIPTGIKSIDNNPSVRFTPGEYIIIAGRPAMGKTQLMTQIALNIAKTSAVLYNSFDMSAEMLLNRFLKTESKLHFDIIQNGNGSKEELKQLTDAIQRIKQLKIFVNDIYTHQLYKFMDYCHKQIEENDVKVIFVDYLQLMGGIYYKNREQEISMISRELKSLARDYKVTVIVSSQLSRAVEVRAGDKRPILSDLRDSGSLEQDADKVFAIYRPEYYGFMEDADGNSTHHLMELLLVKNRNGAAMDLKLISNENFSFFNDFEGFDHIEKIEIPFITKRMKELDDDQYPF